MFRGRAEMKYKKYILNVVHIQSICTSSTGKWPQDISTYEISTAPNFNILHFQLSSILTWTNFDHWILISYVNNLGGFHFHKFLNPNVIIFTTISTRLGLFVSNCNLLGPFDWLPYITQRRSRASQTLANFWRKPNKQYHKENQE